MIDNTSNLFGYVIGEHLSHTFSPQIHTHLANYSYGVKEIEKKDLGHFIKSKKFDFLNVTIPYKKDVVQYLDFLSKEAERIGAVNTIKKQKDGSLTGYNTDYYGFEYTLKKSGIDVKNKKVLVLGSGGASLPIKSVLFDKGAKEIITISRSGENNYNNLNKHSDSDVIVNATPVGMFPNNGVSPISLSLFPKCSGVIDIIYNPQRTALLLDAEKRSIPCIGGLDMLVAQAKKAAEIFTDQHIDENEIERIVNIISFDMRNIILIGMPGCGKTTIGSILSEKTNKDFYDSDIEFEKEYGTSPADILNTLGETKFREMEHDIIVKLGNKSNVIIATGGGVVTREYNYLPLHQNGKIIFIDRNLSSISTDGRPISKHVGVEELYKKRLPLYTHFSDYIVDNNNDINVTANNIIRLLKEGKK